MAINFAAASTAGLNNPGTEIITLVKDGSGSFINPPSYNKILAYLRSGDVPCLFVTDEAGTTGDIYQLRGYSETENKIRFSNDANAIEFCAGCGTPVVSDVGGGGGLSYDVIVTSTDGGATLTITAGTYADLKAKIEAHTPANMLLLMDITDGAATTRYQAPAMCVALEGDGEIACMVYIYGQSGPISVYILSNNTAEIRL